LFTLGSFSKITEVAQLFGLNFTTVESYAHILEKMGWAAFWAMFFLTHLVNLALA
jgi:hypothetical protein